ncbi:MAG TPA: DUF2892 domain-containing protein [Nocardioides sp.]|nr:DUF2892 domain-containing protein [Nocardioides sp.]
MNVDRAVLALAGTLVLSGSLLAVLLSPWWLLLTGFVGANLLQSSVTGFCPAALVLQRLGVPAGCAFRSTPQDGRSG